MAGGIDRVRRTLRSVALAGVVALIAGACEHAGPTGEASSLRTATARPTAVLRTAAAPEGPDLPPPPPGGWVLPVDAEVRDPFRAPTHRYGAGNRGWELATVGGEAVAAVGAGTVRFAGSVAGRGVVTLEHPGGLLSSLTGLSEVAVGRGDVVVAGERVGTAAAGLHLGFRWRGEYVDPALVFGVRRHARLVAVPGAR